MWEYKKLLQPVKVEAVDLVAGQIKVTNGYHFSRLSGLDILWQLYADDRLLQAGSMPRLETPPGGSEVVSVPFARPQLEPGVECWLTLSFRLGASTPWAERGHEVAWAQFKMPFDTPEAPRMRAGDMPALELAETETAVTVQGSKFKLTFDKAAGTLSSLEYRGAELIDRGPRLNLWRAPTDNDAKDQHGEIQWRAAGLDRLQERVGRLRAEQLAPQVVRVEVQTVSAPTEDDPAETTANRRKLLGTLTGHMTRFLDADGLLALCQRLGVPCDELPEKDIESAVSALVLQVDRQDRVPELLQAAFSMLEAAPADKVPEEARDMIAWYRSRTPDELKAEFAPRYEASLGCTYTYTVYGSGDLVLEVQFAPQGKLPPLPRIGLQMRLPGAYDTFTWYGRGPHESYADRQEGARMGVYTGSVDEQYEPYIVPQENGNKTGVRWVALTDADGLGLLAVGSQPIEVSAHHYSTADLDEAKHTYELVRRDEVTLNLDYRQAGLGSASCGPGTRDEYLIQPEPVVYSVRLRPFFAEDGRAMALSKHRLPQI
jgi:hypothetical protein